MDSAHSSRTSRGRDDGLPEGRPRSRCPRLALAAALLAVALVVPGCVYVGGDRPAGARTAPRSIDDDWRRLDFEDLMAFEDTWFVIGEDLRGTVRGFANGAAQVVSDGGYFELSVIYRRDNVPIQETVRVYFDDQTPVYVDGKPDATVMDGLAGTDGLNVSAGGRVLEVPFHLNGGRLYAEQVNVLEDVGHRVP